MDRVEASKRQKNARDEAFRQFTGYNMRLMPPIRDSHQSGIECEPENGRLLAAHDLAILSMVANRRRDERNAKALQYRAMAMKSRPATKVQSRGRIASLSRLAASCSYNPIYQRGLGFEFLEGRTLLTVTTVSLVAGAVTDLAGNTVLTSAQAGPTDLVDTLNQPIYWQNGDTLIIPSTDINGHSFSGAAIAIEDSGGSLTPIAADEIHVQAAGVTLEGETTADELYVDPANPTSLVADSGDDMTISAAVAPLSTGSTTLNTTSNAGSVILSGTINVNTIDGNASSLAIASGADVTAGTVLITSGNFTVAGTLSADILKATASADTVNLTGTVTATTVFADAGMWTVASGATVTATTFNANGAAVTIDGSNSPLAAASVTAPNVNVFGGNFEVDGKLMVFGAMQVSDSAVLQGGGADASIILSIPSSPVGSFTWASSASGQFLGRISGSGSVTVAATDASAILTLGSNSYTGGTTVSGGTLKFAFDTSDSIPAYTALYMAGTSTVPAKVDLDGSVNDIYFSELTGGPYDTVTNSSAYPTILFITGTTTSVFSGTIEDGNGGIEIWLESSTLDLSADHADFSGISPGTPAESTYIQGGNIKLNAAQCSTDMLESIIYSELGSTVTFCVPAADSVTFYGTIYGDTVAAGSFLTIEKVGPGTLTLDPDVDHQYLYTEILALDGTLNIGSIYAFSTNTSNMSSGADVEGGATLGLGNLDVSVPFSSLTLGDGAITDGTFNVLAGGAFNVEYGLIAANFTSTDQTMNKIAYDGGGTLVAVTGVGTDTVLLSGTSMQVATTAVNEGTLEVASAGVLTSNITVNNAAVLTTDAGSLITGSVTYGSSATSTVNGQIDDIADGATVTAGKLVITSASGLADGSALSIGDAAPFAAPIAGSGDGGDATGARTILTLDPDDGDSGPVTDNGLTQFKETIAAGQSVFNALMSVRYPEAAALSDLSVDQSIQLVNDFSFITFTAIANNGDSSAAMPESTVNAAIGQLLESMGKTATANDNVWTPTYNNPWGNGGITIFNYIAAYYATHDIS